MKLNYLDFISASEKLRADFHKWYRNLERVLRPLVASVKLSGSCRIRHSIIHSLSGLTLLAARGRWNLAVQASYSDVGRNLSSYKSETTTGKTLCDPSLCCLV